MQQRNTLTALFSEDKNWTKGAGYRLNDGTPVYSYEASQRLSEIGSCCLMGGAYLINNFRDYDESSTYKRYIEGLVVIIKKLYPEFYKPRYDGSTIKTFNDDKNTTLEMVREVSAYADEYVANTKNKENS